MIESQLSICTWADATFGPPVSDASIAARALVEMAELVTACVYGRPAEEIGEEIADVVIVLARLGRALGVVDVIDRIAHLPFRRSDAIRCAAVAVEHLSNLLRDSRSVGGMHPSSLRLCVMWLVGVADLSGVDLPAAIDRKMAINRARRWNIDGNGHGTHVKERA